MKAVADMTREEVAAYVCETLVQAGINTVLSGGSCVSIYTENRFISLDLDFITFGIVGRMEIGKALKGIGFAQKVKGNPKYFVHTDTALELEFPSGVPAVGDEIIEGENTALREVVTGTLRLLTPTDCIKDRLAAYYYHRDGQCLEQAIGVARCQPVKWNNLRAWHEAENELDRYYEFRAMVDESS